MARLANATIQNADVIFRNFAGAEKPYNAEGDRNFCVVLDSARAEDMKAEGWNVKTLRPKDEGDEPRYYVQVSVNYSKGRPPRVVLVTNNGNNKTDLGADEVGMLDYADVREWDIVLSPYEWEVNGNTGVKAYLKQAYVVLDESELDEKYADLGDPTKSLASIASD